MSAPRTKRRDARAMMGLRPRVSVRGPESGEVRRARSEVEEVMRDWSVMVRGRPRERCRERRVEEMMPVLEDVSHVQ